MLRWQSAQPQSSRPKPCDRPRAARALLRWRGCGRLWRTLQLRLSRMLSRPRLSLKQGIKRWELLRLQPDVHSTHASQCWQSHARQHHTSQKSEAFANLHHCTPDAYSSIRTVCKRPAAGVASAQRQVLLLQVEELRGKAGETARALKAVGAKNQELEARVHHLGASAPSSEQELRSEAAEVR